MNIVSAGVTRRHGVLTVFQRQFGGARAVHDTIDIDVVLRIECQSVNAPGSCFHNTPYLK